MTTVPKVVPFLAAAVLIAAGLACKKPAPAPVPAPAPAQAPAPVKTDDGVARRAEEDARRKAEEAEAARKAAAEAAYRNAAQAALQDIHFAFDKADIQETDKAILTAIADFMKAYPQANVRVEGNCDERGTVEYNLALGDRRASAAQSYLTSLGVPAGRLSTISFGKEKPVCTQAEEACWSRNRRAHFTLR